MTWEAHKMKNHLSSQIALLLWVILCIRTGSTVNKSKHKEDQYHSGVLYEETMQWAVRLIHHAVQHYEAVAMRVAQETGLVNRGRIGHLQRYYLFQLPGSTSRQWANRQLETHNAVHSFTQQVIRKRYSRRSANRRSRMTYSSSGGMTQPSGSLQLRDPAFKLQWHLINRRMPGHDLNVLPVWQRNITGKGVTTAVVDDGLQWQNPDLLDNYNPAGSWDFISNDPDPTPDAHVSHGTRCAGEIAAVANQYCGVGVAFHTRIAGIRLLGAPLTDALEATAFTKNMHINDIYSCSWGPEDSGRVIDGPQHLAATALRHGVTYGRRGYGAIYVVASGNGGVHGDNCNFDGYANSIYTITIGAVDENRRMPVYAEECASMLAVTYSSGSRSDIVTTDWLDEAAGLGSLGCTMGHSGTSAATPLAAGIIALMLQARPCLSWRDVQHIIAMAAVKVDIDLAHWHRNSAGLHHSHKHGFGLMDAWRLVNTAKVWPAVPWLTSYTSPDIHSNSAIPVNPARLKSMLTVTRQHLEGYNLNSLEYVQVAVTMRHERRGDVEIRLRCPTYTESVIAATRHLDNGTDGFNAWQFSTVRCWGESPLGKWTLIITDKGAVTRSRGQLLSWSLRLYGSSLTTQQIKKRIQLVDSASNGQFLYDNFSLPCPAAPVATDKHPPNISHRLLKIAAIVCIFLTISAVSESLEYLFCYNDEKRLYRRLLLLVSRMHRLTSGNSEVNETSRLITDESNASLENVSTDIRHDDKNGELFTDESGRRLCGKETDELVDSISSQHTADDKSSELLTNECPQLLVREMSKRTQSSESFHCLKLATKNNDGMEMNEFCADHESLRLNESPTFEHISLEALSNSQQPLCCESSSVCSGGGT